MITKIEEVLQVIRDRRDSLRARMGLRSQNNMIAEAQQDFEIAREYDGQLNILEGRSTDWP